MRNRQQYEERLKRDKEIYRWYLSFAAKKGRLPTLEEMGNFYGVSRERARQLVARLERTGYLTRISTTGKKNIFALNVKNYAKRNL